MKFAKIIFTVAGIYGLVVLVPLFFMEGRTGRDYPPPVTHPEFYYGFVSVAVAWQVLFLLLARDPRRYRLMMIPSILEKIGFGIAGPVLYFQQRLALPTLVFSLIDLLWAALFAAAYLKTKE
ncbi:MAG TPA: hypothetical protein VID27_15305 [Blastocatellia bacterium]|jgi:hypothetical protein